MDTLRVVVSGTVGKQVIPTPANTTSATRSIAIVRGFLLTPVSAAAYVIIRDGNASGDIKLKGQANPSSDALHVDLPARGMRFDKGMHVKVLGSGAECYVYID